MGKDKHNAILCMPGFLCFNPCFNGWMGKDISWSRIRKQKVLVSILVLMDGWVKTSSSGQASGQETEVSILVLMDGWVKTKKRFGYEK